MGTRHFDMYYETEEEAKAAVSYETCRKLSTPNYSEVYWEGGPTKVAMNDGTTKWKVSFKEYYG